MKQVLMLGKGRKGKIRKTFLAKLKAVAPIAVIKVKVSIAICHSYRDQAIAQHKPSSSPYYYELDKL